MRKLVFTAALALLSAACGGGGGGGGPWLTFNPSRIEATVEEGQSGLAAVTATAHSIPKVRVNAGLIFDADAATVFRDWRVTVSADQMSYTLVLETRPALAAGTYEGLVEVRVCEDADPTVSCQRPYGGSPWHIPYRITVTPGTPPTPGTNTSLDFEGDQVARWKGAGGLVANPGDLNQTIPGVTFTQDTAVFQAGSASLKISGPMVLNVWGTDYLTDVRAFLNQDRSFEDLTGHTLSVYFHLGAGTSSVDTIELQLVDTSGRPLQGKYQTVTGDTWQHVTFKPCTTPWTAGTTSCDAENYRRPDFDLTHVQSIILRISNPTGAVTQADWNVDSITW